MVEIQFVGDISELCEEQRRLIISVLEERGFQNGSIDVQSVGKADDNFVANVKRITVEQDSESFTMIAKVAPRNDVVRAFGHTAVLFQNEDIMYNQVLTKFTALEESANIPKEERLRYAACYGTYLEAPNEIILLEDLIVPGFKILDRHTSLTDENVRLVLKNFASLHSLSYVLKNREPETFEMFCKNLVNIWLILPNSPEMMHWLAQIDVDVQILLDDDKYKNAVKNTTIKMITQAAKLAKLDTSSKHSVIQQGDAWTNNIMFRLENERSVECCMIDYQISKLSKPVADVLFMIFNCTDYAMRAQHYYDWIDYYHLQLDKRLANFGLKANYHYPRDQFDADLKRFAKVSLGEAIMEAAILARDTAGASQLKEAMNTMDANSTTADIAEHFKLSSTDSETIGRFKAKVKELVDSFTEFGYL